MKKKGCFLCSLPPYVILGIVLIAALIAIFVIARSTPYTQDRLLPVPPRTSYPPIKNPGSLPPDLSNPDQGYL